MELRLKASIPTQNSSHSICYGIMILEKNKIVKFIEDEDNIEFLKIFYKQQLFPIKRNEYTIEFLSKYDDNFKLFNTAIKIKDSFNFYVKLNWFEKIKLKWMLNEYLIQSREMKIDLLKYLIGGIFGFITTVTTQEIIKKYKNEQETEKKIESQKPIMEIKTKK